MRKNIGWIPFLLSLLFTSFACKQTQTEVIKSVLKINSITVDGKTLEMEELKSGTAKIDYKGEEFEMLVDAELANVDAVLNISNGNGLNEKVNITKHAINSIPFIAKVSGDVKCTLTFTGEVMGKKEYKFTACHLSKQEADAPHLTYLKIGNRELKESDIKDEMDISISYISERLPIEYKTDKDCYVKIIPNLVEGMLLSHFGKMTKVDISLEGDEKKTYVVNLYVENGNVTTREINLTHLKVNGKEIRPIQEMNHFVIPYNAPYNIAIEAVANNGVIPKFSPELKEGKIGVGFAEGEKEIKIILEKEGFTSKTYSLIIEREAERLELRTLTVNGHAIQIKDEMNFTSSYSKNEALIKAQGKFGTTVHFNPTISNGKLSLAQGETKKLEIIVSKADFPDRTYILNVKRDEMPTGSRPSRVESVMIAPGLDAINNFEEIAEDFPNTKVSVKRAIVLNEYTLKIEALNENDVITLKKIKSNVGGVEKVEDKVVTASKKDGSTFFYNIAFENRDVGKSSIDEFKIIIEENGMQKKEVTLNLCFEGTYAQGFKKPIAKMGEERFEPFLTKLNYLEKEGVLKLNLQAWDPLSKVTQEDGSDFSSFSINIDDDEEVEIPFYLTTCSDRKLNRNIRFKVATGKERTLLDYLKFYPATPDIYNGNLLEYATLPSPRFRAEDNNYKLELYPGDWTIFFDLNPTIKTANVEVSIAGQNIEKETYLENGGNEIKLYKLSINPKETKNIIIKLTSDKDPSIENEYRIEVIAPDDDSVANFDALFYQNDKEIKTVPPVGKKGGIRLPPQDHNANEIKMQLKAQSEGVTFTVKQAKIQFTADGKAEIKEVKPINLDGNSSCAIASEVGMTYIIVEAKARNGFSKVTKIYEVYKFSETNKVYFEISPQNEPDKLQRIEMSEWQALVTLSHTAPLLFKGHAGSETKGTFVLGTYEDYKASKPFKSQDTGDHKTWVIPKDPKLIMVGTLMPDNARLYYLLVIK